VRLLSGSLRRTHGAQPPSLPSGGDWLLFSGRRRGTKRLPIGHSARYSPDSIAMGRLFQPLLFLLARSTADDLRKQVEFLKAENELLRKRVPRQRIFLKAGERARLLKLGKELGPAIRHIITIVEYSTYRRWVRKESGMMVKPRKGRPRIAEVTSRTISLPTTDSPTSKHDRTNIQG